VDDPVSWLVVERGWKVVGANGSELGKVEETVGDSARDIFSGLTVAAGLLHRPRFVPAELVAEIVEGSVRLTIGENEFEGLEEHHEPPPSAQIRPE
jgi:hypothetical protein